MEAHEDALKNAQTDLAAGPFETKEEHNLRQSAVFGSKSAEYFASEEATPKEVMERLDRIASAASAVGNKDIRILDVGIGTGNLAKRYPESAKVVGVDVSEAMLQEAKRCLDPIRTALWLGDIADFSAFWLENKQDLGDMLSPLPEDEAIGETFDTAVFNACFGNVFNQSAALASAAQVVKPGGTVIVAHPLGADFVDDLRAKDASVVPHALPRSFDAMQSLLAGSSSFLKPEALIDDSDFYLATWRRMPASPLQRPLLVQGKVQRGYGRGSRKLGFPTANLPENLFGTTLQDLPSGVYTCWAFVQGDSEPSPAVANCGISPTFVGKENPLKIIEAHIIDRAENTKANNESTEFYDQPMTLLILAFQRPERKFPSFPKLVSAIESDVQNGRRILSDDDGPLSEPDLIKLKHHPRFIEVMAHQSNDDISAIAEWISPSF